VLICSIVSDVRRFCLLNGAGLRLNDDYYRPVLKLKCGQVDVFLTV
jgi:hypothetical protein